jgi:hypothetical protein
MTSMSDLYETDIVAWSEQQAELLRRRAAGDLVNEAALDWPHIAEEIEDVGKSERRAVESAIIQALLHDLKLKAWPNVLTVSRWRADVRGQLDEARFTPSMRQHIDMAELYRRALRKLPEALDDGTPALPVPDMCPWTLDQVLDPEFWPQAPAPAPL